MIKGIPGIVTSTLLSGGVIENGTVSGYISDAARRSLGLGIAQFEDGQVHYLSKNYNILERALIQRACQLGYGLLRSYPRFLKYWERKVRDKYLQTQSQTSIANKTGQYYKLISSQQAVAQKKNYTDSIVGRLAPDYLELQAADSIYYDSKEKTFKFINGNVDFTKFVDLHPSIQVSSKNNIVLTTVQGRDYSRKEYISGGDLEITINGKITSKYPDVYPEGEVSKFLKLMQLKSTLACDNIILRQFNISKLIVLNYSLLPTEYRNIQPYTISCVAVEPSEAVEVKTGLEESVDEAINHVNKWIKIVKLGTDIADPSNLLKLTKIWL